MGQDTNTPVHQWTNGGSRVLLVKCIKADGTSYNGFRWPESGPVKPLNCSRTPDCESGGLFGWPWGLLFGSGKYPDYTGRWLVFSAPPAQVILINSDGELKAKVASDRPEDVDCIVEYCGSWWGAMEKIAAGRDAWITYAASGAASNSGDSGAASNSGDSGAASNSGYRGAASNSGYRGAVVTTGEYSTLEVSGLSSVGAVTATDWYWRVHAGAIVLCRWVVEGIAHHKLLDADALGLTDGAMVRVHRGEIIPM